MRTGGALNIINEKYRCNDPQRTIRISALMRVHNPRSEEAMLMLLEQHTDARCTQCGEIARNGGIAGWTDALWSAVQSTVSSDITREHCAAFVYDLYVKAPVRGFYMEDCALSWLQQHGYKRWARLATPHEDCLFATDIVLCDPANGTPCCGIQVKPVSYRHTMHAHAVNIAKNATAGYPIFYLYYNNHDSSWLDDGLDVLTALWAHCRYHRYF